jgi:hypothetical protein
VVKVQGFSGRLLAPNRDYLLCFKFRKAKPAELEIAMNFVPPGVPSETNCESLERALGLVVKAEQFETPNSAGPTNK